MVVLTELTDAIFHPVRHKILSILNKEPRTISEITKELNDMSIAIQEGLVRFHIAKLQCYELVSASPIEKPSSWREIEEGRYQRIFQLNKDKLKEQLRKAQEMLKELS